MTGRRLIVGIVVMGFLVPFALMFLLGLHKFGDWFAIAASCFLAWGVADLVASILERPRLKDRTAKGALRDWEQSKREAADALAKSEGPSS